MVLVKQLCMIWENTAHVEIGTGTLQCCIQVNSQMYAIWDTAFLLLVPWAPINKKEFWHYIEVAPPKTKYLVDSSITLQGIMTTVWSASVVSVWPQ